MFGTMITTARLFLRAWREEDLPPFARMNADAEVRRYFPGTQTTAESNASARRIMGYQEDYGHTYFAAELRATAAFIGFVGMIRPDASIGFPEHCLELGWRIDKAYWGQGLATEGAGACMDYAFTHLDAPVVGAITTVSNAPSRRVMEKLGMRCTREFLHPDIDRNSPVAAHVMYLRYR